jgi:hypothetical protein
LAPNVDALKGKENSVADGLLFQDIPEEGGKVNAHSMVCVAALMGLGLVLSESLKAKVIASYPSDHFCTTLQHSLPLCNNCVNVDRLLFIEGRLVILDAEDLQDTLINNF